MASPARHSGGARSPGRYGSSTINQGGSPSSSQGSTAESVHEMQGRIAELQERLLRKSSYGTDKVLEGRIKQLAREAVFPHMKWIFNIEQLAYSERSTSISSCVVEKMNIEQIDCRNAWTRFRPIVDKGIIEHRNNVVNYIKEVWMSECQSRCLFLLGMIILYNHFFFSCCSNAHVKQS